MISPIHSTLVLTGSVVLLTGALLTAHQAAPGPYTTAQADAGRTTFHAECAPCHGAEMQGGVEEPPLAGPRFIAKWRTRTTHDLLNFIQTRMPPQNPGGLGEPANLELVAHILRANGVASGPDPLTSATVVPVEGVVTVPPAAESSAPPADVLPAKTEVHPKPAHTGLAALVYTTAEDFKTFPMRPSTWVILGVGGALAAIAHPADNDFNAHLVGSKAVGRFWAPGKYIGGAYVQLSLPIAMYVVGRYIVAPAKNEPQTNKWSHLGFDLLQAQIVDEAIVQSIKHTVRRDRPTGVCCSFPSGHSAAAFAAASVFERHFGYRFAWPTVVMATYVATSRLHDNVHYLSDVLFGAAVGTATGWTVVGRHGRSNYAFAPVAVPGGVALSVTRRSPDTSN